jgi:dTDP-4-dehydrorhamnose 3,5-epimerase
MGFKIETLHVTKIHGLLLTPLKQIGDERGSVFHYLKSSSPSFNGFGEAYYSKVYENVIKGWKCHSQIFQNFCVPYGRIKIVIYDNRPDSSTQGIIEEIILDEAANYSLLSMPPDLWYAFKCESEGFSLLANIINLPHDPAESNNLPLDTKVIPYEWK